MLFAFDVYNGIIIKNSLDGYLYDKKTKELIVYSNHSIRQVAQELEKKYNQKIWHRFIGLPGSV
jgi:aromatic ring-opening dioxygenase catalytic subunit (LigB family)